MLEIFTLSDSGADYYFEGENIFGVENNRVVKYYFEGGRLKKSIEFFGANKLTLFNGKHLIAQNKTFYITE